MRRQLQLRMFAGLSLAVAGIGPLSVFADSAADSALPSAGSWREHKYSFAFLGFTSTYSCDGLADKLKLLLLAAGARSDVKSQPGACAGGFGRPDKFARADVTFYTLSPDPATTPGVATPGVATPGVATPGVATPGTKIVNGVWRPVSFASRQPRDLATGDCELVEQFKTNLLPMFAARSVNSHTTCIPHQDSGSVIDLKFEAFTAAAQLKGRSQ